MLSPLILYAEINIVCIIICVCIMYNSKKTGIDRDSQTYFEILMVFTTLFFVSDTVWNFASSFKGELAVWIARISSAAYFVFLMYTSYFWVIYATRVIFKKDMHRAVNTIVFAIYHLFFVIAIASIWTGWLFTVSDENVYARGPLYIIQPIIGIAPIAILSIHSLVAAIKEKDIQRRRELRSIGVFIISPIIFSIVAAIIPGYPILCVGFTIAAFQFYITLYNRYRLIEYKEQKEAADAANVSKSRFLANMSHEIRTPINAIMGLNEDILRNTNDQTIIEDAYDIKTAATGLLNLINEILDISKIESGKFTIQPVEYKTASMIHNILTIVQARAKDKNLDFTVNVDESIPGRLIGDDVRVQQIIVNIITNAIKYTIKGSVSLVINWEKKDEKAYLSVKVADTGMGIKQEDLSKILDVFERVNNPQVRNIEGAGLGLNITANLLKLMDSKLEVSSTYGEGSVFSFILPQLIADEEPIGPLEKRFKEATESQKGYESVIKADNRKILIVDDNKLNIKVVKKLLSKSGITFFDAMSGRSCLEICEDEKFDLIFMDHMMPEMDGIETFKALRDNTNGMNAKTPVVIMTANALTGAKEEYLAHGFDAYLSKPVLPEELDEVVMRFVKG